MMKKRKQYLWLPYLSQIKLKPKTVEFSYKGGEVAVNWQGIHSIMIYGNSIDLPQDFLEKCAFYKIPIIIHRRNMPRAVVIAPTLPPDQENLLTRQILFRENKKKRSHIAKKLLQAKFQSMNWLTPVHRDLLYRMVNLEEMTQIESWHARRYWEKYYGQLNLPSSRRSADKNVATITLDAVSKFVSSILLRWVLYHNLSPYHGFLHKPTNYPALVYDLMEPYRGYFDKMVLKSVKELEGADKTEAQIIGFTVENVKEFLDQKVYVRSTRQIVTFHELLHGVVLALRAYLLGDARRFVVPIPSRPNGGRPIKAGYLLYGHTAGKTDFWEQARQVAQETSALTENSLDS
jgi:CRISPR/Cas system-associated endonuclease Cas1